MHVVQELSEEDFASRLDFAADELQRFREDPLRLHALAFSDEAHFYLDGAVNRHNHRYWAPEILIGLSIKAFTLKRRRYGLQFVLTD